jgi:hypothetical protein
MVLKFGTAKIRNNVQICGCADIQINYLITKHLNTEFAHPHIRTFAHLHICTFSNYPLRSNVPTRPRMLKIKPAGYPIHIQNFPGKVQAGMLAALHGVRVYLR